MEKMMTTTKSVPFKRHGSRSLDNLQRNNLPVVRISFVNSRLQLFDETKEGNNTLRERAFNVNKEIYDYLKIQKQKKAEILAIGSIKKSQPEPMEKNLNELALMSPKLSPKRTSYFLKVLEERQNPNINFPTNEKTQEEDHLDTIEEFDNNEKRRKSKIRRVNSIAGHDWRTLMYIPKDFLEKAPLSAGSLNTSFVSFQDIKTIRPGLFPKLYENVDATTDSKGFTLANKIYEQNRKNNKTQEFKITKELKHNAEQKEFFQKTILKAFETVNHDLMNVFSMRKKQNFGIQKVITSKKEKQSQTNNRKGPKRSSGELEGAIEINIVKDNFCFHWFDFDDLWDKRPIGREGATLEFVNNLGYLIGGRNHTIVEEISVLNLANMTWEKIAAPKNNFEGFGRANHSSNILNNNIIIIFGGERSYDSRLKIRECLSDVKIFNLDKKDWANQICRGDVVEARRNHISQVVGKSFLVYGGLNSKDRVLNDFMVLDLGTSKWENVLKNPKDLPYRAYHTAVSVFDPTRTLNSLFSTNLESKEPTEAILMEGVYVFGGKNEDKKATNSLILFRVGAPYLKWEFVETKGKPPSARYAHGMVYYHNMGIIAIHGGRNDEEVTCYNDIHVLSVASLNWCHVSLYDSPPEFRYSFACGIKGSKMFIFGGINFEGFTKAGTKVLELDQNRARIKYEQQTGVYFKKYNKLKSKFEGRSCDGGINQTTKILSFLPVPGEKQH